MKRLFLAIAFAALSVTGFAQSADEPASKDDMLVYLRTMHSHDMLQKVMQVQVQSMRQLFHDMLEKEGKLPADFDSRFNQVMGDLVKNMPMDELIEAMIPAYQKHFTKGDIEAMNTFYSSPVGQKVLQELPAVVQEGSQAAMPLMSKYLETWKGRMDDEFGGHPSMRPSDRKPATKN
jgi:hypothetical protein